MGEVNFMQQGMLAGRMLAAFKRSVEIDPDHLPGYIGLSRYYQSAPAIAGGSMEKAIELDPKRESAQQALATLPAS